MLRWRFALFGLGAAHKYTMQTLADIFDKVRCDKGPMRHNYDTIYQAELEPLRFSPINILEVGINRGCSLSAWLEYFSHAEIYSVDTFERVIPQQVAVLKDPRVHWIQSDSTRKDFAMHLQDDWGEDIQFDVIIDDGAHDVRSQRRTLENLHGFLKPQGVYFIEDHYPTDTAHYCVPSQRMENLYDSVSQREIEYSKFYELVSQFNAVRHDLYKTSRKKGNCVYVLKLPQD